MGLSSCAQFEEGDHSMMLSGNTMLLGEDFINELNIEYKYQFADRWSIAYSLGVGRLNEYESNYFNLPGGLTLAGGLWANLYTGDLGAYGIVLALVGTAFLPFIPDKLSYDFFLSDRTVKLSPFLRVLSFDHIDLYHEFRYNFFYRFGFGTDITFIDKSNRWLLGGIVSYRHTLETDDGLNIGAKVGLMLNYKSSRKIIFDKHELGYD